MSTIIIITPKKRNAAAQFAEAPEKDTRTSVFTNVSDDVVEKIVCELDETCQDRIDTE